MIWLTLWWKILFIILALSLLFPLIWLYKNLFKKELDLKKSFTFRYTFWLFFIYALFLLLINTYWLFFTFPDYELIELKPYFIIFWVFSVYILNYYFEQISFSRLIFKKWIKNIIVILAWLYLIFLVPIIKNMFYDHQLWKSNNYLSEWYSEENFKKSKNIWFLDKAYLRSFTKYTNVGNSYFKILYDSTPEWYFWDKLDLSKNWSNTRWTNLTNVWKNANVILSLIEIKNEVISSWSIAMLNTTYEFNFTNTTNTNQEVIINFQTPSVNSVVYDLKLWLNLQYPWQIAPREAARRVYEDSLRLNIDPALIEKLWLNTYNLRVFPIPAINDSNFFWKQKVQFSILTPILKDEKSVVYSPKLKMINIKFDDKSWIVSKLYNEWQLKKEDVVENKDIESYLDKEHTIEYNEILINNELLNSINDICIEDDIFNKIKESNIETKRDIKLWNKINIFFDNSLSVDRNKANKNYKNIYDKIKKYSWSLQDVDLYTYNFTTNKIINLNEISYWGYSEIDNVVDYITSNNIENQRIILVTDDDSFNLNQIENKNRSFEKLGSNMMSVIKIWNKTKTYKSDFNTLLSATNWNIYELNKITDLDYILDKIFENKETIIDFDNCKNLFENEWKEEENRLIKLWCKRVVVDMDGNTCDYNIKENNYSWYCTEMVTTIWLELPKCADNNFIDSPWLQNSNTWNIDKNLELFRKIQWWYISNYVLSSIKNENDWMKIANVQTIISEKYWIVNQFNSYIALENEQQQDDLNRYKEMENKYDSTYNNYESESIRKKLVENIWLNGGWWNIWLNSVSVLWDSIDSRMSYNSNYSSNLEFNTNINIWTIIILIAYILQLMWFIQFIRSYIMNNNLKWIK